MHPNASGFVLTAGSGLWSLVATFAYLLLVKTAAPSFYAALIENGTVFPFTAKAMSYFVGSVLQGLGFVWFYSLAGKKVATLSAFGRMFHLSVLVAVGLRGSFLYHMVAAGVVPSSEALFRFGESTVGTVAVAAFLSYAMWPKYSR